MAGNASKLLGSLMQAAYVLTVVIEDLFDTKRHGLSRVQLEDENQTLRARVQVLENEVSRLEGQLATEIAFEFAAMTGAGRACGKGFPPWTCVLQHGHDGPCSSDGPAATNASEDPDARLVPSKSRSFGCECAECKEFRGGWEP